MAKGRKKNRILSCERKQGRGFLLSAIMAAALLSLTGCGKDTVPAPEAGSAFTGEGLSGAAENAEQKGSETESGEKPDAEEGPDAAKQPGLPETGGELADFVPEGWKVLDSAELDFNEDGCPDYVAVLEVDMPRASYREYPRILFAVASDKEGGYRLQFQDINLIRTGREGGSFDPYEPLSAEGMSFTTRACGGGSVWRWSEEYTYLYWKWEGTFYLMASEVIYYVPGDYGDYDYIVQQNDWKKRLGIRKKRSSDVKNTEEYPYSTEYDIEYEIRLDRPLTIEQAGKRREYAPNRITDWEVSSVICGRDVELSEDMVKLPGDASIDYCDEDRVLYRFSNKEGDRFYIAEYRFEDRVLSIPREEKTAVDHPKFYKGRIYYTTEIVEEGYTVGIRLNRMEPDGTKKRNQKESLFSCRYPEENELPEGGLFGIDLLYEISGDEIVVEVYGFGSPYPFYRMNTNGRELELIEAIADSAAD